MKKLISILLVMLMLVFVVACGDDPVNTDTDTDTNTDSQVSTDSNTDTSTDTNTDTNTDTDTESDSVGENNNDILGSGWTPPQKD